MTPPDPTLAADLAAAPCGSRGLDERVARVLGWTFSPVVGGDPRKWLDPDGKRAGMPEWTTSLDAAVALVPKTATWQVTQRVPEDQSASADVDIQHECRSASTPALALCIAALKARGL